MPHTVDDPTPDQPTAKEETQPEEVQLPPFPVIAGTAAMRCHMASEQLYKSGNAQAAGLYEISATIYLCTAAIYEKLEKLVGAKEEEVPDAESD